MKYTEKKKNIDVYISREKERGTTEITLMFEGKKSIIILEKRTLR